MSELAAYTVIGLSLGGIFALAALGIVLIFRATGVLNFAHGAMGMVAAFTYWEMRFGMHWPAPVALFVCLVVLAPAFGILLQVGIMRRLEGTSETTKLVVTLSLFLLRPLSPRISRMAVWRPIAALGTISYSLYLIHQFNLNLVATIAQRVLPIEFSIDEGVQFRIPGEFLFHTDSGVLPPGELSSSL